MLFLLRPNEIYRTLERQETEVGKWNQKDFMSGIYEHNQSLVSDWEKAIVFFSRSAQFANY